VNAWLAFERASSISYRRESHYQRTGAEVILRRVNRSELEYSGPDEQGFLSGASISRAAIQVLTADWRCNIVRLPFNQDFVLRGRAGRSAEEYRAALDQVIFRASTFGTYTILYLQWLDANRIYGGNRNFVAPLPNAESIDMWALPWPPVTKMSRRSSTTSSPNRTIACPTIRFPPTKTTEAFIPPISAPLGPRLIRLVLSPL
jgi:hypothetical protein